MAENRKHRRATTSRKKKTSNGASDSVAAARHSTVPQLNATQKKLLVERYEDLRNTKVALADHQLRVREIESLAAAKEAQFRATCDSVLRGAGVDLDAPNGGQYTIEIANDCEVVHKPAGNAVVQEALRRREGPAAGT